MVLGRLAELMERQVYGWVGAAAVGVGFRVYVHSAFINARGQRLLEIFVYRCILLCARGGDLALVGRRRLGV